MTRRNRHVWIIDFKNYPTKDEASLYAVPFEYLRSTVSSTIEATGERDSWWLHWRARAEMFSALAPLSRFVVTPAVSKHRVFVWQEFPLFPDHALIAFARSDDYSFGVLQARIHEWALKLGTRLETRPRYTPTTSFETFPFPEPTLEQSEAIASAAKELDDLRSRWLNPSEWTREGVSEFPGSIDGPWARYISNVDERGIGTVRYPRLIPKDEEATEQLKKRTLTNLYNERPTWLDLAHRNLDEAVFAAYGWESNLSDEEILSRLLELNLARAALQE